MRERTKCAACAAVLGSALLAAGGAAAAVQATAQGTVWGTVNGTPVLLDVLDIAVLPDTHASVDDTLVQDGFTFDFEASADFATGLLKVRTVASTSASASGSADATSGSGLPTAFARLVEQLTFTPSNADPYTVTVTMTSDGTYTLDPTTAFGWGNAQLSLTVDGSTQNDFDQVDILPATGLIVETLTTELQLQGTRTVNLFAQLAGQFDSIAGPNAFSAFEFGNSAQLALNVPASVNVTSGSGVFLTAVVPLPPALPLLAVALTVCARRRRQTEGAA